MTQTNTQTVIDGIESSEQDTACNDGDESGVSEPCGKHGLETVDPETRVAVLERDGYRCQVCGRRGPESGGLASLHAHHIERDPDGLRENDPENLTTLCRSCHSWVHQQATPAEAPVKLSEADLSVLLPQDVEILRYLADAGPARTGEVADALTADLSVTAVRERLALLMGLDRQVASRDRQIVDQDVETGEWGLVGQIERSARGHIPDDPQALVQRVEDEQVRQALERGCDRDEIMNVLDVSRRTTFHKEKRAYAYDFPLDVFRRCGNGGQHPAGGTVSEAVAKGESGSRSAGGDGQQQLDAVGGERSHGDAGGSGEDGQATHSDRGGGAAVTVADMDAQEQLDVAITALEQLSNGL